MYDKFNKAYQLTSKVANQIFDLKDIAINGELPDGFQSTVEKMGGNVFNDGLLKMHSFEGTLKWTKLMRKYFAKEMEADNIFCFAGNWQGCMYCTDMKGNMLTYFDPATCEFFQLKGANIQSFFENILVDDEYDILFEDYFYEAKDYLKFDSLDYNNSVGHKLYLHLGGEDDVDNLEVVHTEVLWELQIQVAERINNLPDE